MQPATALPAILLSATLAALAAFAPPAFLGAAETPPPADAVQTISAEDAAAAARLWPDPNQPVVWASDADAAAVLAELLAQPMTRNLLALDDQLAKGIPELEKSANVRIDVDRVPLIEEMLRPWWQLAASGSGAPRPILHERSADATGSKSGYGVCLCASADDDVHWHALVRGVDQKKWFVSEHDESYPGEEHLAIIRGGHLLFFSPAQAREIARPLLSRLVVDRLAVSSPLHRKVDVDLDGLPLSEAATILADLAHADLVMPTQAKGTAGRSLEMPLVTVHAHAKEIEEIFLSICDVIHWKYTPDESLFLTSRSILYVDRGLCPALSPQLSDLEVIGTEVQPPATNAGEVLLAAIRNQLRRIQWQSLNSPEFAVRPMIKLQMPVPATGGDAKH